MAHGVKVEGEKIEKYLDIFRQQKKLTNVKVIVILVVVYTLGKVSKGQEKRVEKRKFKGGIKNKKVKLATVVEGDQKAPFTIATTTRCRRANYSSPWIASHYP